LATQPVGAQDDARDKEIARLRAITDAQQKQIDILTQQQKVIQDRLLADIELLSRAVKEREAALDKLQLEKKRLQIDMVNMETRVKAADIRTLELLKQNREIMDKLRLQPAGANPIVRTEFQVPTAEVNGKIEKFDGDLVQINVGADAGLAKNHTLEVYRLTPEAKYLGMIRIVEVGAKSSVGRLVPAGNTARPELRVGDLVASRLNTRFEKAEPKKN
jgi:hypothetical protein